MLGYKSISLADALVDCLRENGLEHSVAEVQVEQAWSQVMGEMVASMTKSVEVKNGMLIVRVTSAALKAQLFENRFELVRKLNEHVGLAVIKDCRILG